MTFLEFSTDLLQPLEKTSSKLEQTKLWAEFLKKLQAEEVAQYLYLSLGQMGPTYANPQFNFGLEFMLHSLALVSPSSSGGEELSLFGEADESAQRETRKKELKKRYKQLGDVGILAQEILEQGETLAGSHPALEVDALFASLQSLTQLSGEGSQEQKIYFVADLFKQLDPLSARYVARMILGTLRLGFSDKTLLDAFSWYLAGDKSLREIFDEVYQRHPDIGEIGRRTLSGGEEEVQKLDVEVGVPVLPALCDRLKSAEEMIKKMGEVYVEPKYDGTRVQIHWDSNKGIFQTYTRNLEQNTFMFPELPRLLQDLKADSVILDCEAVGYNPETNSLLLFQETIKRKRKHDIEETMASIPLRFFVFDVLLVDGKSVLRTPLQERKALLQKILPSPATDLQQSPDILTNDPQELREFHAEQLALGFEGAVIKKSSGVYQPGRQAFNWVKFKEAEGARAKLTDTIDAVVVGNYSGRGKRTAFGVGAFLIAIRDEANSKLVTIAKIGTGLSDDQWRELKQRADSLLETYGEGKGEKAGYELVVPEMLAPDVYLPLEIVVEVAADEITKSPLHSAGLALRFPRLVRFRDDKSVEQITTLEEMKKIRVA
jgi:DNA ligase-1